MLIGLDSLFVTYYSYMPHNLYRLFGDHHCNKLLQISTLNLSNACNGIHCRTMTFHKILRTFQKGGFELYDFSFHLLTHLITLPKIIVYVLWGWKSFFVMI